MYHFRPNIIFLSLVLHTYAYTIGTPESESLDSASSHLLLPLNKTQSNARPQNLSAIVWPEVPYKITIPKRKGNQFILVTKNDRQDHGFRARTLALKVCKQVLAYIQKVPIGSLLTDPHWEHLSYGDYHHAEDFSIWMHLVPTTVREHPLDREMAFFAVEEFRGLVAVFGAMEGEFEIWAYEYPRARVVMHTWQWPREDEVLGGGDGELG